MKKIFFRTSAFLSLIGIIFSSCNESGKSPSGDGDLCFDTATYKRVYNSDNLIIISKKKDEKQLTQENDFKSFAPPIDIEIAKLLVKNNQSINRIGKSIYIDFPMDDENIIRVYKAATGGKFRIYFGAYDEATAKLKDSLNPNKFLNRSTVVLVPVNAGNQEDHKNIVNLGSLCPPETCDTIKGGAFNSNTLAGKAGLKP
jgi:hypothetical protein